MEIEEAIGLITANAQPIKDVLTVSLDEAYGHVLAEDLTASVNVPAFPRSAMDGYAVRSGDITDATTDRPVRLKVTGKVIAGQCADIKCEAGTAVRIMTGAMIPDGYDAVVMQEDTDLGQDLVSIYKSVGRYVNYCHEGEEIKKGDTVLTSGTLIGMIETGLIASLGKDRVSVRRPIKVSIISTGSELTRPGNSLPKGCIYGNIRYMLASAIKGAGFEVAYSDDCPDDREIIIDRISQTTESDVIITTGGVSVGEKDLIAGVLSDIGAKVLFSRASIQPGTPTMASIYDGKSILSLSGNPYAALACFDLYFPPLAAALMGCGRLDTKAATAVLCDPYEKAHGLRRLVRAYEENGKVYLPADKHMSSVFGNMSLCNCYIDVPANTRLSVGDSVCIRRMRYR